MPSLDPLGSVDYLAIGHLSCDLTPRGPCLGGTAAYSALTARALGLRVGLVTAWAGEMSLEALDGVQVRIVSAERSTTFENVYSGQGRLQVLHHVAPDLTVEAVPEPWRAAEIVHLGPIAGEGKDLVDDLSGPGLLGLTPQGWLRTRDADGRVRPCPWPEAPRALAAAGAAVISLEDVAGDEDQVEAMASACKVLAVTEGAAGARLYWNGDLRRFRAPGVRVVDPTGAGDVFAAAFFWRLHATRDPWAAARFATHLASFSVTRRGLAGIPTQEEIQTCLVEVM
jgi:sugar/nucleoside kinase (ribokinase family)